VTQPTGWYGMACWNGLSADQQRLLIEVGCLPFGRWVPEGGACPEGAEVAVETMHDTAPGPRFYCRPCAVAYLGKPWQPVAAVEEERNHG
jgi:hypothetical protein